MSANVDPRAAAPALDRRRPPTPWSSHFAVARSHPWLILAATLFAVAVAAVYVTIAPRRYEAHAELLVSVSPSYQPALEDLGLLHQSTDAGRPAETIAWLAMTNRIATHVSHSLGGHPSAAAIHSGIVAQPVGGADVVDIAATASSATTAAAIANADAKAVLAVRAADLRPLVDRLLARLQVDLAGERPGGFSQASTTTEIQDLQALRMAGDPSVHLMQSAPVPSAPSWPKTQIVIAGAALVGFLVGVLGAFAVESRDPRLRSPGQLRRVFAAPTIATIPAANRRHARGLSGRRPVTPDMLGAGALEQIRTLSHRLVGRHCVLVTGASGREGRTTVAMALAHAAALSGRETILLELDARTSAMADALTLYAHDVHDVLAGRTDLDSALATPHGFCDRLRVLPAGRISASLADLPQPRQLVELVQTARELADLVIVDVAPLGVVGDGVPLVAAADLTLMVVRIGATRLPAVAQAAAELEGAENYTVLIRARSVRNHDRRVVSVRLPATVGG
jgi:Mrp family chromosome partitioning ATPase/capsular polysaccharide biosynthesis protein